MARHNGARLRRFGTTTVCRGSARTAAEGPARGPHHPAAAGPPPMSWCVRERAVDAGGRRPLLEPWRAPCRSPPVLVPTSCRHPGSDGPRPSTMYRSPSFGRHYGRPVRRRSRMSAGIRTRREASQPVFGSRWMSCSISGSSAAGQGWRWTGCQASTVSAEREANSISPGAATALPKRTRRAELTWTQRRRCRSSSVTSIALGDRITVGVVGRDTRRGSSGRMASSSCAAIAAPR